MSKSPRSRYQKSIHAKQTASHPEVHPPPKEKTHMSPTETKNECLEVPYPFLFGGLVPVFVSTFSSFFLGLGVSQPVCRLKDCAVVEIRNFAAAKGDVHVRLIRFDAKKPAYFSRSLKVDQLPFITCQIALHPGERHASLPQSFVKLLVLMWHFKFLGIVPWKCGALTYRHTHISIYQYILKYTSTYIYTVYMNIHICFIHT